MRLTNWIRKTGRAWADFARRAASETRGNVAMLFAISLPILILITMGGVDIHRISTVRVNVQDALDAATLAAARSPYTKDEDIQMVGMAALRANLKNYPNIALIEEGTTFDLQNDEVVVADAKVNVKTLVANIFLPPYGSMLDDELPVSVHSEVNRSTKDIEVSLVLDITGSMEGSRLTDLQTAANDLVDLVVQPDQTVNKTRMALVPYSMGVNAGDYLNDVRGAARGTTNITGAAWMVPNSQKTVSAISKANPGVFTATAHGYSTGDFVWVSGVTDQGGTGSDLAAPLNGKVFRVVKISANTFSLENWNGVSWGNVSTANTQSYTGSSGITRRCYIMSCEVVVTTATNHGLSTGDDVRITSVAGMTQINTQTSVSPSTASSPPPFSLGVTRQTDTTFSLTGWVGPNRTLSNYTSGGKVQCLEYGCSSYLFTNNSGALRVYFATSCVSERVGSDAYTDAAPSSSARVAYSYAGTTDVTQGGCMSTSFTPLTTNRETLHDEIGDYKAEGGTAGQIGVGWGWYMVSPTFGAIFPTESRPEPYGTRNLLKVVIIMTDGEFNAVYYNGVRARDSGAGGGADDRWINHDSNNGSPFIQAVTMCTQMKRQGVIVYTVGFDITSTVDRTPTIVDTAKEVMEQCATDASHVYLPNNGTSLKTAFGAIGRSISQLRISK